MLRFLWQRVGNYNHGIPTYSQGENEDAIDLQIKSLLYMLRRYNIPNLQQFNETSLHASSAEYNDMLKGLDIEKLDAMYNKSQFERILFNDEHRVLIDWAKNKFRSLCILSGFPTDLEGLPRFNNAPNFRFIVLPADSSDDKYVDCLANSDIYVEHLSHVSLLDRENLARAVIRAVRRRSTNISAITTAMKDGNIKNNNKFTKDQRAIIIKHYLESLAQEVQVERLYRASIRIKGQELAVSLEDTKKSPMKSKAAPPSSPAAHKLSAKVTAGPSPSTRSHFNQSPSRLSVRSGASSVGNTVSRNSVALLSASPSGKKRQDILSKHDNDKENFKRTSPTSKHVSAASSQATPSPALKGRSTLTQPTVSSTLRSKRSNHNFSSSTSPNSSSPNQHNTLRNKKSSSHMSVTVRPVLPPTALDGSPTVPPAVQQEIRNQARTAVLAKIEHERSFIF